MPPGLLLADRRLLTSAEWLALVGSPAHRARLLLVGVADGAERARLLRLGLGEVAGRGLGLAELEARLCRGGFFRAHRAYLVNLQHVREVIPFTRNSFSLRLDDAAGTQIPLSKSAAAELRGLLDY